MISINGKEWLNLTGADIEEFLSSPDTEESFFFEFKEDRVEPKKVVEEISAFANTYGGYIFLGVTDSKEITGCSSWNEQRIQTTIHDSITPTPSFDVKKLICSDGTVFVIRIDEGSEPPYITNQGKIYERLSSGSFVVRDSSRLTQMYNKNEQKQAKTLKALSIEPVSTTRVGNIYGYIDIGFSVCFSDPRNASHVFFSSDIKEVAGDEIKSSPSFNLSRVGETILYTPGGLSSGENQLPAHLNNFLEIMSDGSARMRVLLHNNDPKDFTVNMIFPFHFLNTYREFYRRIMGKLFPESFIYAKKYEELTVLKQFQPVFYYEDSMVEGIPKLVDQNERFCSFMQEKQAVLGKDRVITNNRIPKTGLYTIDKSRMQSWGITDYTAESILEELFYSQFATMCYPFGIE